MGACRAHRARERRTEALNWMALTLACGHPSSDLTLTLSARGEGTGEVRGAGGEGRVHSPGEAWKGDCDD
jgi:hypothetical protein